MGTCGSFGKTAINRRIRSKYMYGLDVALDKRRG
jgi:hypothetical protein